MKFTALIRSYPFLAEAIQSMYYDNGGRNLDKIEYEVTIDENLLSSANEVARQLSKDDIETISAGDQDEAAEILSKVLNGPDLESALGYFFEDSDNTIFRR